MNQPRFGPAGNPDDFYESGYKRSEQIPAWLVKYGLNAYEYQCGRGVMIKEDTARKIGAEAKVNGIKVSVHAPYFISLATADENTLQNTRKHFLASMQAAQWLDAYAVIFHIGGAGKGDRRDAYELAKARFAEIIREIEAMGLSNVKLAPETHGKANQLGNLAEIIDFCTLADWIIPAIDFGHLNSVGQGYITDAEQYEEIFAKIRQELGAAVANNIHVHFSQIEYTKAGEKQHMRFGDGFGPPYEPFMEVVKQNGYCPTIICESKGTQARDALAMLNYYNTVPSGVFR